MLLQDKEFGLVVVDLARDPLAAGPSARSATGKQNPDKAPEISLRDVRSEGVFCLSGESSGQCEPVEPATSEKLGPESPQLVQNQLWTTSFMTIAVRVFAISQKNV